MQKSCLWISKYLNIIYFEKNFLSDLFTVKRRLRDYRREQGRETEIKLEQNGLFGSSGKVVLTAIAM